MHLVMYEELESYGYYERRPLVMDVMEAEPTYKCFDCLWKGEDNVPADMVIKILGRKQWHAICIDCADDYDMSLMREW
jgi:hypothetical protein